MAQRFTKFVLKLGKDPKLLAKFKNNPQATMKKAGLTKAEASILLSKSAKSIRAAIVADIGAEAAGQITVVRVTAIKPAVRKKRAQ
jgi:hypothetical protein